jgi:hypothetical protein
MRILILDDLSVRHERFRAILNSHDLVHIWTYDDAVAALRGSDFDMACFDHDLGDLDKGGEGVEVDSDHFKLKYLPSTVSTGYGTHYLNGADLCFWLYKNPARCPPKVLIHSRNVVGAGNMKAYLEAIQGVSIRVLPFEAVPS